ncbi:MAG: ABC transporter permease [Epsilonproteobacteria bacterium]|nr:ABC transporter permease [Campylobacterota bacterium]
MQQISFLDLVWILIPIIFVYFIYKKWNDDSTTIPYAISRMFLQLILLGYLLTYIFTTKNFFLIITILTIMLLVAGFIALRPVAKKNIKHYFISFVSIAIGGIITLCFVIFCVLDLELWYEPRFLIPLAGMIFANSMNSVSLAGERFEVELERENSYEKARNIAYKTSLIKDLNSLFAVGLVSIPGMMTGQILGGVDPMIAVVYQIMVMCMIIASSGISTAVYLKLLEK